MCMGGGSAPRPQPPVEPMKNADAAVGAAENGTRRQQALRRGLAGTFTRYNADASAAVGAAGGTTAKADKLGG